MVGDLGFNPWEEPETRMPCRRRIRIPSRRRRAERPLRKMATRGCGHPAARYCALLKRDVLGGVWIQAVITFVQ